MEQLTRQNLSDQISEILSKKIIRNELKPGETIYETRISRELGVSRSPVREALRMLEHILLVERTPRGGYQVTEFSNEMIQHLYETAIVIYQYAFSRAAEKATREDTAALEADLLRLEEGIGKRNFDIYLDNVTKLASRILEIAGNPVIERIALELMPTAERVQWASITCFPDQLKTVVGHLRRGYQCIVDRDPRGAAKAFEDFAFTQVEVVINSLDYPLKQKAAK